MTLHFFKLVAIVRMRMYLDFELDESYTPTKMVFLAGMGGNDLVEFATWACDAPCGWVDVPLEGVGGRGGGWVREDAVPRKRRSKGGRRQSTTKPRSKAHPAGDDDDDDSDGDSANGDGPDTQNEEPDPYAGNVLKAMVIQMRILENHQNGKDTHVRGFQVFSCDESRRMAAAPSASADGRDRRHRHNHRESLQGGIHGELEGEDDNGRLTEPTGLTEPEWMGEPVIR